MSPFLQRLSLIIWASSHVFKMPVYPVFWNWLLSFVSLFTDACFFCAAFVNFQMIEYMSFSHTLCADIYFTTIITEFILPINGCHNFKRPTASETFWYPEIVLVQFFPVQRTVQTWAIKWPIKAHKPFIMYWWYQKSYEAVKMSRFQCNLCWSWNQMWKLNENIRSDEAKAAFAKVKERACDILRGKLLTMHCLAVCHNNEEW